MVTDPPHRRLKTARQEAGWRYASAFAALVGMPEVTYRAYESGARAITPEAAQRIAPHLRDPKKTWQWLLLGKDIDPRLADLDLKVLHGMVRRYESRGRPDEIIEIPSRDFEGMSVAEIVRFVKLRDETGEMPAAIKHIWRMPSDYLKEEIGVQYTQVFIYAVRGDGMAPTFISGDRILIDQADKSPPPAGIFLIQEKRGLSLKRVEIIIGSEPLRYRVSSDNARYGSFECDVASIEMIGRAVWLGRRL